MRRLAILILLSSLCQTALADDKETVQGQGGRVLRYSSTQVRVAPSPEDMRNYLQARDARLDGAGAAMALQAGRKALEQLGYKQIEVDTDYSVIRAEKDETLVSEARQTLRGLLKLKFPLPGKPDHQTTEVLLTLRPGPQPGQLLLRTRIRQTVWDSNGNSRTLLCSDPAIYRQLYEKLASALDGQR
ncbi:hypothetical protein [Chromobacterium alticapitis]|uniref:DUF4136 domain-containing protein n=1 Tax=Chromobacterium alticapitis TaxID=2073169 RepID=A0A2S5DFS0_9NEIS|nr:hypothetical protein [Chromobacterium alticapitis]POZ61838.1 hypothetical protein C2I19_11690 [Chromobacterium alticapitis]